MIIRSYGLHWQRSLVRWGRPGLGNQGSILGQLSSLRRSDPVDFRNQAGIYVLQDNFKPLYVGQTGVGRDNRLFVRLRDHTRNHLAERWNRFSWFGIERVENGQLLQRADERLETTVADALDHIEGVLIAITEPALNRQGARFGDAKQYRQTPANDVQRELAIDEAD